MKNTFTVATSVCEL